MVPAWSISTQYSLFVISSMYFSRFIYTNMSNTNTSNFSRMGAYSAWTWCLLLKLKMLMLGFVLIIIFMKNECHVQINIYRYEPAFCLFVILLGNFYEDSWRNLVVFYAYNYFVVHRKSSRFSHGRTDDYAYWKCRRFSRTNWDTLWHFGERIDDDVFSGTYKFKISMYVLTKHNFLPQCKQKKTQISTQI